MLASKAGYRVFAFEPMPANRQLIAASVCLNPDIADKVHVLPVALSTPPEPGFSCVVQADARNVGDGIMRCGADVVCPPEAPGGDVCTPVNVSTLDDQIRTLGIGNVVAAKMDVEGHECSVVAGGQSLFTHLRPPYIQVEIIFPGVKDCILKAAAEHGYHVGFTNNVDMTLVRNDIKPRSSAAASPWGNRRNLREQASRRRQKWTSPTEQSGASVEAGAVPVQ